MCVIEDFFSLRCIYLLWELDVIVGADWHCNMVYIIKAGWMDRCIELGTTAILMQLHVDSKLF